MPLFSCLSRTRSLALLFGLTQLLSVAADAAQPMPPPSKTLLASPHVLVVAELENQTRERAQLRVLNGIGQATPTGPLSLRLSQASPYAKGDKLLLVFSDQRKNPVFRKGWEPDPQGPKAVSFPEAGDAIFPAHPALLDYLGGERDGRQGDAERLPLLLKLLAEPDAATRYFVCFELLTRPALAGLVDAASAAIFERHLLADGMTAHHQDLLLQFLMKVRSEGMAWREAQALRLLRDAPGRLDLAGRQPGLLETALHSLALRTAPADAEEQAVVTRHLGSNAPGVAKAALALMVARAPQALNAALPALMADSSLNEESRRVFSIWLERGELAR